MFAIAEMRCECIEYRAAEMRCKFIAWLSRSNRWAVELVDKPLGPVKNNESNNDNTNVGNAAEIDMRIKQMNQLPRAERKPYNYLNKCTPDHPPLRGFMLLRL